ncbi:DALR domain [Fusobacterium necrophorum subsp. necrophorum]|nr:DALR domain [Fusobacterium necrophorum subsp. necrophorum]
MDEDFNTAQAIGVLFELVRELNKTLDSPYNQGGYEVLKKTATYLYHILYDVWELQWKWKQRWRI